MSWHGSCGMSTGRLWRFWAPHVQKRLFKLVAAVRWTVQVLDHLLCTSRADALR